MSGWKAGVAYPVWAVSAGGGPETFRNVSGRKLGGETNSQFLGLILEPVFVSAGSSQCREHIKADRSAYQVRADCVGGLLRAEDGRVIGSPAREVVIHVIDLQ